MRNRLLALALVLTVAIVLVFDRVDSTLAQVSSVLIGSCRASSGSGSPESVVTGKICDLYVRTDGGSGTVLYVKESGTGNTGWVAHSSASGLSNPVTAAQGGTGLTTYAIGDLVYASAATTIAKLADVATGNAVISGGVGVAPSYGKIGLTTHVSGILPTANGGTNQNSTATFPASGVVTTDAGTSTFTNKTLDVEGTGNVFTTTHKLAWRAAYCQNATAVTDWSLPATDPAVAACITGTNTQRGTLNFADGGNALSAQQQLALPSDFTGSVDIAIVWQTTATTGDVVWQVATICVADAETGDPAFNAASTVTDTAKGVASQFNAASITGLTTTGCAAGETMFVKLSRDPAHASDTLAATASVVSVELTLRRAQ